MRDDFHPHRPARTSLTQKLKPIATVLPHLLALMAIVMIYKVFANFPIHSKSTREHMLHPETPEAEKLGLGLGRALYKLGQLGIGVGICFYVYTLGRIMKNKLTSTADKKELIKDIEALYNSNHFVLDEVDFDGKDLTEINFSGIHCQSFDFLNNRIKYLSLARNDCFTNAQHSLWLCSKIESHNVTRLHLKASGLNGTERAYTNVAELKEGLLYHAIPYQLQVKWLQQLNSLVAKCEDAAFVRANPHLGNTTVLPTLREAVTLLSACCHNVQFHQELSKEWQAANLVALSEITASRRSSTPQLLPEDDLVKQEYKTVDEGLQILEALPTELKLYVAPYLYGNRHHPNDDMLQKARSQRTYKNVTFIEEIVDGQTERIPFAIKNKLLECETISGPNQTKHYLPTHHGGKPIDAETVTYWRTRIASQQSQHSANATIHIKQL